MRRLIKIDGNLRTCTFKQKKSVVPLKDDHPFQEAEGVIIISQKDYQSILLMIKELEHDKVYLKRQIKDLIPIPPQTHTFTGHR